MKNIIYIAVGGALGALTRYGISKFINQFTGGVFPWGTLAVNFLGLFIIGFLFELFERTVVPSEIRSFLTIGFLGALTTFSTYGIETLNLLRDGEYGLGLMNVVLSNVAGIGLVVVGIVVARMVVRI
jgi:fluoride exporter